MLDIALPNLITAFGITLAAGLFTVLGSGLVMFSKTPNRAYCRSDWRSRAGRWCMCR